MESQNGPYSVALYVKTPSTPSPMFRVQAVQGLHERVQTLPSGGEVRYNLNCVQKKEKREARHKYRCAIEGQEGRTGGKDRRGGQDGRTGGKDKKEGQEIRTGGKDRREGQEGRTGGKDKKKGQDGRTGGKDRREGQEGRTGGKDRREGQEGRTGGKDTREAGHKSRCAIVSTNYT
ncbi:hypothetical protein Pmani_028795 [Petrolisthes manimaculis]|uniref:Uncharacterized protein n=1 Tax=Petrolisthes manimaculis TaxID=1843537 RepID=A0AAE1TUI2_9EUCA|nr:hypothetical protein Pmani_028795 [Petrolisthes manimaculis]